ncbi:MAG TPA: hypothetical protein VIJ05_03025, partial [Actinomycetes bacterium]
MSAQGPDRGDLPAAARAILDGRLPPGGRLPPTRELARRLNVFEKPARFDFRTGISDATLFPYQSWRRLLARQLRPAAVGTGAYG